MKLKEKYFLKSYLEFVPLYEQIEFMENKISLVNRLRRVVSEWEMRSGECRSNSWLQRKFLQ